jgi:hypothetical protein
MTGSYGTLLLNSPYLPRISSGRDQQEKINDYGPNHYQASVYLISATIPFLYKTSPFVLFRALSAHT